MVYIHKTVYVIKSSACGFHPTLEKKLFTDEI